MKLFAIAALAATLPVVAVGVAPANATGTMHGVQHGGVKARCSPGDPNVLVNKTAKTFVIDAGAKAAMKPGAAKSATGGDEAAGASSMSSSAMVSMCKSEALSMGAKMTGGGAKKASP
ncbi:MAG: hypothetical protein NVS3B16_03790 [Vulcanimicrobiaceae bacterium]